MEILASVMVGKEIYRSYKKTTYGKKTVPMGRGITLIKKKEERKERNCFFNLIYFSHMKLSFFLLRLHKTTYTYDVRILILIKACTQTLFCILCMVPLQR